MNYYVNDRSKIGLAIFSVPLKIWTTCASSLTSLQQTKGGLPSTRLAQDVKLE